MRHFIKRVAGSIYVIFGVVLIWRGVWILLDKLDFLFFQEHETLVLAVISILVGLLLLYLHDHKLDELGHL